MDTVAYIRVSSRSQNLATQRDALEQAARARGDSIRGWYIDKASGKKLDRPELNALRQDVCLGKIRKLYVFRIDRLTRSGIRDTLALVEEIHHHGCLIETVADGFSFAGSGAEIVLAVLAWAAQMERTALGERISAARQRVEAEGGSWGRPHKVDPGTAARMRAAKKSGKTQREIARAFKICRSTVQRVLAQKGHYAPAVIRRKKSPT